MRSSIISYPSLVISDSDGNISAIPELEASGMKGGKPFRIEPGDLIKLPPASQLFKLPARMPIGYIPYTEDVVTLKKGNAVAAFVSPGYTITHSASYKESAKPRPLPLFSYGAVALYKGEYHVAAVRVDKDRRHDCRFIDMGDVRINITRFRKIFPRNRLVRHLEDCALVYGCPGAQNFFLSRYEGPLPTAPFCNARCAGCISYSRGKRRAGAQPRIKFIPAPEEVAEIALFHIHHVKNTVVSFGQGCEGEPLLAGDIIEKAIKIIREVTAKGTINLNTNGSKPGILNRLFLAGLDSVRISLNSAREEYYTRYYKPRDYTFKDVIESIKMTKSKSAYLSINYLTMPGFTDSSDEFSAFKRFVGDYAVDMVQWRNMNYDPLRYFKCLKIPVDKTKLVGIKEVIAILKKNYPRLRMGYFNPALSSTLP